MIQSGILYTIDTSTGTATNVPIKGARLIFKQGNTIRHQTTTNATTGAYSLDVAVGKYTVELAVGSTTVILRAGQEFELKTGNAANTFQNWLYSKSGDINDQLLKSFKDIMNETIKAKDDTIVAKNEIVGNSIGDGSWLRENAHGLGGYRTGALGAEENIGDFGQKTGTYYSTKISFGGAFWLDVSFSDRNSAFRISNVPYSDRFYVSWGAGNSAPERTFRGTALLLHDKNTTVDSNGFLKRASPIIKLFDTGIEYTGFNKEPRFTKLSTGVYQISNTNGLRAGNESGDWYLELPKDRYGNPYFNVETERLNDGVIIRVYEREEHYLPSGRFFESDRDGTQIESFQKVVINGKLIDLKDEWRCISLRFREDQYKLVDKPIVSLFKTM